MSALCVHLPRLDFSLSPHSDPLHPVSRSHEALFSITQRESYCRLRGCAQNAPEDTAHWPEQIDDNARSAGMSSTILFFKLK